jgi:predicted transcriptional regulator of viral defense system
MRLVDAQAKLLGLKQEVLQTSDAAACLGYTRTHASQILKRLSKAGFFIPLARGKWACQKTIDPLLLPEYLTAPAPSYISFQSALYYHGMISQIPDTIYAATLARTRQYKTPVARVSIHHMQPNFFFGFEMIRSSKIKMATPEKALLDVLYFSSARSRLFSSLPELEIPEGFKIKEVLKMIEKIPSLRKRSSIRKKLADLGLLVIDF